MRYCLLCIKRCRNRIQGKLMYCLSCPLDIACKLKKLQYPIFPSSQPPKGRKISKWYCDGVIGVSWGIIPVCTNALCSAANMIIMFHEASRGGGWRIREGRWEWGGICSLGRKMCARNFTCQPASRPHRHHHHRPGFFAFGALSFFMASKFFTPRLSVIWNQGRET